ncbi:MAG: PIN domain-containing protein [Candidatus Aminicenantes bacterium]|nr:PIN domain-containing protein [Candidatus Aminicenantes bacterium]
MIVVGSNLIIYIHVQSVWTAQALQALKKDPQWIAPPLWESEFRNVMAGYMRRKILKLEQAKKIMNSALRTMEDREILPPSNLVLELFSASDCSAYDCEYVALAKHLKIKLITNDQKILQNFPETAVNLDAFSSS